jgi:hypothetical protein
VLVFRSIEDDKQVMVLEWSPSVEAELYEER